MLINCYIHFPHSLRSMRFVSVADHRVSFIPVNHAQAPIITKLSTAQFKFNCTIVYSHIVANCGHLQTKEMNCKHHLPRWKQHTCRMLTSHDPQLMSHIIRGPTPRESKNRAICMRGLALCRVARQWIRRFSKQARILLTVEHKDRQNCMTLSVKNWKTYLKRTGEVCEEPLDNITKGRPPCVLLMYEAVQNMGGEAGGKC